MPESTENTLYNFKTEKKYFLQTLEQFRFTPRYNREFIFLDAEGPKRAVEVVNPMVCWCDIPLERIKDHTNRYGSYGVGISKEWAIKNFINPVIYIVEGTVVAQGIKQLKLANQELLDIVENDVSLQNRLAHILSRFFDADQAITEYLKPYRYQKVPSRQENRKFYDEKEWRYVPDTLPFSEPLSLYPYMFETEDDLNKAIIQANEKVKARYLWFEPEDVQSIILPRESEIEEVKRVIKHLFQEKNWMEHFDATIQKIYIVE